MIKKWLLGIGVFLFGSLSFSYGYQLLTVGGFQVQSNWSSNFDISVLKRGRFLSSYLGYGRNILALNNKSFVFWSNSGLYLYDYENRPLQGYFQYYRQCDKIDINTGGNYLQNCGGYFRFDLLDPIISNFMDHLKHGDYLYIDRTFTESIGCGSYCYFDQLKYELCYSSDDMNKTICFLGGENFNRNSGNPMYGDSTYPYKLTDSMGLRSDLSFGNIPDSIIKDPPFYVDGVIDGSSGIGDNVTISGNVMYNNSCTNGYVVSEVSSWYGGINNVCYAGTYNTGIINGWVAYSPIETGLNYKDVFKLTQSPEFGYYSSYSDWFNSWSSVMRKYKLGQLNFDVFNGQPMFLYAYFNRLYENGGIDGTLSRYAYDVVNFCNLALYSDYNQPYNGSYFSDICDRYNANNTQPIVNPVEIGDIDDNEIIPPGFDNGGGDGSSTKSGYVVSVDWSGTLSGNTNKNFDGKTFINDFYQKLQSSFLQPTSGLVGIIPNYILVFMFALILFRFLQH